MTRPLKVYGGGGFRDDPRNTNRHSQSREIVATTSLTAALRILKPFGVRRGYCCETGNDTEVEIAMAKPGTVFWAPLSAHETDWYESKE